MHAARGFSVLYHVFAFVFFSAPGFSVLYHVFARQQHAFSVLNYVISVVLHYSMLHRFEIFSAPGTIAHCSIRLLRDFSLALIIIIIIIIIIINLRKLFTPLILITKFIFKKKVPIPQLHSEYTLPFPPNRIAMNFHP